MNECEYHLLDPSRPPRARRPGADRTGGYYRCQNIRGTRAKVTGKLMERAPGRPTAKERTAAMLTEAVRRLASAFARYPEGKRARAARSAIGAAVGASGRAVATWQKRGVPQEFRDRLWLAVEELERKYGI